MGRFEKVAENSQQLIRALDKNPDISRIKDLGAGDMADYGSELLKSYVEFIVSTKSFERKKRLRDDKIVSESEFLIAQNNFEKASANFAAARNNIKFELRQKRFDFKKKLKNLAFRLRIAELQLKMLGLTEKEIDQIRKQGTELSGDCNDERCDLSVVSPNGHIHQFGNADFSRLVIRADRSGTIIFRNAVVGEEAEQNRILFSIADLSSLWAVLQMPGRDYNMVKPGMEVEILSSDKISSIGRVLLVHPVMDEKTRSVAVRVALNNESKDWIPNSFITGKISISAENVAVLLKRNAVQTVNGEKVVFVPVNQGFKAVDVTTGRQDRENIEILSGIKPGEKFVSEGAFALKSIMVTSGMDPHAGHGH
jgi:RND family efflux transporter MFP subunit